MELSPAADSSKGRIHALFTRIQLLEQHAITVMAAFRADAMKADAREVITALHRAQAWLGAAPGGVAEVEELVEQASQQLSSLGGACRAVSAANPRTLVPNVPDARPAVALAGDQPIRGIPVGSLPDSPGVAGFARRAADRLPAGAWLPRRLGDRRAPSPVAPGLARRA